MGGDYVAIGEMLKPWHINDYQIYAYAYTYGLVKKKKISGQSYFQMFYDWSRENNSEKYLKDT